jgi:DNA polymerase III alpha subunit
MGLGQVRELTRTTIRAIRTARPFHSLDDFLIRAQPQHVEALNLVRCGALDGLGDPATMLAAVTHDPWRGRHSAQLSLLPASSETLTALPSLKQRAAWENEILGYHVAVHPLDLHAEQLAHAGAISSAAIGEQLDRTVTLGGLRISLHHVKTAQETMLLVDMEDQRGLYQVLWSGAALRQYRTAINQRDPMLVRGRVRRDRHGLRLTGRHGPHIAGAEEAVAGAVGRGPGGLALGHPHLPAEDAQLGGRIAPRCRSHTPSDRR